MNPLVAQLLMWLLGALGQLIVVLIRNLQNGGAAADDLVNVVRSVVESMESADLTGPEKQKAAVSAIKNSIFDLRFPQPTTSQINTLVELAVQELKARA